MREPAAGARESVMTRAASLLFAGLSLVTASASAQVYDGYPAPPTQAAPYRVVPYDQAPSQSAPDGNLPPPGYPMQPGDPGDAPYPYDDGPDQGAPYPYGSDAPPPNAYSRGYPPPGAPDGDYRGSDYRDDGGPGGNDGYSSAYPGAAPPAPVYDFARVVRVDPVFAPTGARPGSRCYSRQDNYGYRTGSNGVGADGRTANPPSQGGRAAATIVGGVVGALVGSRIGGGSARYATSALGTMAGGLVGQRAYDQAHSVNGQVTVCDPVADDPYGSGGESVQAYDVTYEYAGHQYTTRTDYNPGSRLRVRVDVQPQ